VKDVLPAVLRAYNYSNAHKGLKNIIRKKDGTEKRKWNQTAKNTTPFAASYPGIEKEVVQVKEQERKDVDNYYKKDITKLKRRPYVRFFRKLDTSDFKKFEDKFQRQGKGTLTENAYRISGKHRYTNKRKKREGDSFALDGLNGFRVLPYDVEYPSAAYIRKFKKPRRR
jgi:hypothetical protein